MKTSRRTIVATAAFAATCAFQTAVQAQDAGPGKTRAEVIAELDAARASGEKAVYSAEDSGSFRLANPAPAAGRSRADVMAEMFAARASGETAALTGEDSGAAWLATKGMGPAGAVHASPDLGRTQAAQGRITTAANGR